jgi:predicted MFS family arabinose efflux permease
MVCGMLSSSRTLPLRYGFAGMAGMAVGMGIGRFVYTPLLPIMMDSLGLSASQAGWIASANYLGYLFGAIIAVGSWAHGRERPVMLAALAANAVFAALMALTVNITAFLLIRFAAGVASAFLLVFLTTIVFSRLAEHGRMDLQALHFGGVGLGIALSSLLTGWMHIVGAGWRSGWYGSALITLAGLLITAMLAPEGPVRAGEERSEPPVRWTRPLMKLTLAYGVFGFGYIVTATFLVAIVRQQESGSLFESAVWLVTGIAGIPSLFLWHAVTVRIGHAKAFAFGAVVEGIGVIASVSLGGLAGPLIGGLLLGGTFIAITAIGLQAGRLLADAAPRRVLALMTAAFGVGQIIGPIIAGMLADRTGSFFLPSILAAAALLISGFAALSAHRQMPVAVAAR